MRAIVSEATLVQVTEAVQICRDPKDDKFLALAFDAKASHIVTNDQDLLVIGSFREIPIVTPGDLMRRFGRGRHQSPP